MIELEEVSCSTEVDLECLISSGIAPDFYCILGDTVMGPMFRRVQNHLAFELAKMIRERKFGPFNVDNYHGKLTISAQCSWEPINKTTFKEEKSRKNGGKINESRL